MLYDVDPAAYGRTSDKMVDLAASVNKLDGGLRDCLSGQAGMAGTDEAAKAFADGYDKAAPQLLAAMLNIHRTCSNAAELLWTTGDNYAEAEADSTPGGGHKDYPFTEPGGAVFGPTLGEARSVPSVLGGSSASDPGGIAGAVWRRVQHWVGYVWPNGHPDTLRAMALDWASAGADIGSYSGEIAAMTGLMGQQQSPEIPVAVARIKSVGDDLESVSKASLDLGRACNEYAQHIDDAHSELLTQLEEFAAETALFEAGGILLSEIGGEIWANILLTERGAELGAKLRTIIEAFIAVVRNVGARLGSLLARLAEILARTGPKVVPGSSRVGQPLIEDSLRELLRKTVSDYDTGRLLPGDGQIDQLMNDFERWERNVKGNVVDKAMKEAIEDDPFLRQHLTVTPRFRSGPDIIVNNPKLDSPDWYDVTTEIMGNKHLKKYADWGVGKILAWDRI